MDLSDVVLIVSVAFLVLAVFGHRFSAGLAPWRKHLAILGIVLIAVSLYLGWDDFNAGYNSGYDAGRK
jgi:type IV secretory pathway VirB2 component (pilin)